MRTPSLSPREGDAGLRRERGWRTGRTRENRCERSECPIFPRDASAGRTRRLPLRNSPPGEGRRRGLFSGLFGSAAGIRRTNRTIKPAKSAKNSRVWLDKTGLVCLFPGRPFSIPCNLIFHRKTPKWLQDGARRGSFFRKMKNTFFRRRCNSGILHILRAKMTVARHVRVFHNKIFKIVYVFPGVVRCPGLFWRKLVGESAAKCRFVVGKM